MLVLFNTQQKPLYVDCKLNRYSIHNHSFKQLKLLQTTGLSTQENKKRLKRYSHCNRSLGQEEQLQFSISKREIRGLSPEACTHAKSLYILLSSFFCSFLPFLILTP
jgi:hypothetical protein